MVEKEFKYFWYAANVHDGFPVIAFQFENSLSLPVYPHNYLFEVCDTEYCIGWQVSGMQAKDGQELTLLGDIALSDKLVLYDLANHTIGWAQYNYSSSIKVKDEGSVNNYDVVIHDICFDSSPLRASAISVLVYVATVL